ncbi:TRAP transporter small permease [Agrococcus carbonis]|uniref:TRAP-type mannitol/chloroaromatic compound transport system, small permease component n=1 Tax=Agrococcus carbonis TaxID=684552 RepID=A0A1H1PTP8_9MICO|nr:TRAP transporter small permease [Agrococcus carbonis]SDS14387.1 TRAP-type mannitol/chloroaromatic compound transport system, small permease component [Agrococcus carbonis]
MRAALERFTRWVTLPLGTVAGGIVILLMLLTVADVAMRKLSGRGVPGTLEYSEVLLVIAVFLAIAAAQARGYHVNTMVLTQALPLRVRRWVELVGAIVGAVVVATMAIVSVEAALVSFQTGEYRFGLAHVPIWPARVALAIGLVLFVFEYIRSSLERFLDKEDHTLAEELAEGHQA